MTKISLPPRNTVGAGLPRAAFRRRGPYRQQRIRPKAAHQYADIQPPIPPPALARGLAGSARARYRSTAPGTPAAATPARPSSVHRSPVTAAAFPPDSASASPPTSVRLRLTPRTKACRPRHPSHRARRADPWTPSAPALARPAPHHWRSATPDVHVGDRRRRTPAPANPWRRSRPDAGGSKPRRRRSPATVHGPNGCAGETADPRGCAVGH